MDVEKIEYRESYLADIYDAARIVDQMDNIHFFQRPMVARDILNPADFDFNAVYASIKGTTKHVGCSFTEAEYMTLFLICCIRLPVVKKNGELVHLHLIVIALLFLP